MNKILLISLNKLWTLVQGIWLFILYFLVGYIMVGSLGALQLRDNLEAVPEGPNYEEVNRHRLEFNYKINSLMNKSFVQTDAVYNEYDKNERERFDLLSELLLQAEQVSLVDETDQPMSDKAYADFMEVLRAYCGEKKADAQLCEGYEYFNILGERSNMLLLEAEQAFLDSQLSAEQTNELAMADLRAATPHQEHFSTLDFMEEWGFLGMLTQPRELLVLQLTMVMGMLGSLVAMTWSYIRREITMSARRTLFLPLVGAVSAFIIFVFFKAGQLTISSGSGVSSLSPFFLSFVGIISGLLSERAYARMEVVGTKFFTVDEEQLRWAVGLQQKLTEKGVTTSELAKYLDCDEASLDDIVRERSPARLHEQRLISACLRCESREIFTDQAPIKEHENINTATN